MRKVHFSMRNVIPQFTVDIKVERITCIAERLTGSHCKKIAIVL